jgi:integration host factor subunit beta
VSSSKQQTYNRSDIESALSKEFPHLTKSQISLAIDSILESIVDAVAFDDKVEIRGFGTFSKKYIRPRKVYQSLKQKKSPILERLPTMHFKPSKSLVDK